jgi:hypothetical protein
MLRFVTAIADGGFIYGDESPMTRSCDRCGSPLIQIDHYDDRLTGCLACNLWQGDKSAFIVELEVGNWEALGKLRTSMKWTLRHNMTG